MSNSDLIIEHLNLRLPEQFSSRANGIGRELVRQLGKIDMSYSIQLSRLDLPTLSVYGGESNQVIARKIASSVKQQITHHIKQGK